MAATSDITTIATTAACCDFSKYNGNQNKSYNERNDNNHDFNSKIVSFVLILLPNVDIIIIIIFIAIIIFIIY